MTTSKHWKIYKHTLLIGEHAGWSYIGQTCLKNPANRWKSGYGYYPKLNEQPTVFYFAIIKYGWENFAHEILEDNIDTLEKANEREIYWITFYHTYIHDKKCRGYNMTLGGDGTLGYRCAAETKIKLSSVLSEAYASGRIIPPMKNKRHSDETKKLIGNKNSLHTIWAKGKKFNEAHRKHISQAKSKPIICIETQEIFESAISAATKYKFSNYNLSKALRRGKVVGGYHWAFLNDIAQQQKLANFINKPRNLKIKSIRCIETNECFKSIAEAQKIYSGHIAQCLRGEIETASGYHWEYLD